MSPQDVPMNAYEFYAPKVVGNGDGGEISFQPSIIFILIVMLDSFPFFAFFLLVSEKAS